MSQGLLAGLAAGRRVYGTLVTSPSPHWPPIVKSSGVDFVFIDTEHIALNRETVSWMCRAYDALGLTPIVRIPSPSPYEACQALDGGARGVVAPYIETADEVRALAGAVKRRPLKGERLRRGLVEPQHLEPELRAYLDQRNAAALCVVNIESLPAIDRLDEILSVEGLDAVLVGPHDLSCSLGLPEQYDHPRFDRLVCEIITRARAAGVAAGVHMVCNNLQQELEWIRCGANLVIHSGDLFFVQQALARELGALRRELGDEPPSADERGPIV
jgi:4-hydroxy-2-oxoheptanedioate aldolase